jgi:hypothetical protein
VRFSVKNRAQKIAGHARRILKKLEKNEKIQ